MAENTEQNLVNELENLKKQQVELTKDQKDFYENIIKKQNKIKNKEEELQKIREDQLLKQKFQRKSNKKPGTLGILGNILGSNLKGFVKDLPFISTITGISDQVKERKKERIEFEKAETERQREFEDKQAEILKGRLETTDDDEKITPEKELKTENKEDIKEGNDKLDELIKVNDDGFTEIKNALIKIDKEEDAEKIMEDRDYERNLEDTEGKIEAVGKEAEKRTKDMKKGGLLGSIGGAIGKVSDLAQTARTGKDIAGVGIKGIKNTPKMMKNFFGGLKRAGSKMGGNKKWIMLAIAAAGLAAYGITKAVKGSDDEKVEVEGKATGGLINDNELLGENGKPEFFIGGEKGTELKLDNESTNKFFKTASMLENINRQKNTNKMNNDSDNILSLISNEIAKINNKFSDNTNILNAISKKDLGNYNIANMMNDNRPEITPPKMKYFYET